MLESSVYPLTLNSLSNKRLLFLKAFFKSKCFEQVNSKRVSCGNCKSLNFVGAKQCRECGWLFKTTKQVLIEFCVQFTEFNLREEDFK